MRRLAYGKLLQGQHAGPAAYRGKGRPGAIRIRRPFGNTHWESGKQNIQKRRVELWIMAE